MTERIQPPSFEESVRKRPFMYIGNERIEGLITGLIIDCIELCKTDEITFEIIISDENNFILGIKTEQDLNPFWQSFSINNQDFNYYLSKVLKIISSKFEIKTINKIKFEIHFSLDKEIIPNPTIDYLKLTEKVLQIAFLNRQCEIITIDQRQKFINQNYYHFPQGIFYLFDRVRTEVLGKPEFILTFDNVVNNKFYQIGIAYRTDWFPKPYIMSFANDVHTVCNGSLVEGVLDGLVNACKIYIKENNLTSFKVSRKKLLHELILICAVRGENFKYGGSWKETLEDDAVKKEVKKLVSKLALDFFKSQKEKVDKFFMRFDQSQFPRCTSLN
ncbi:MAG TPA: hypothetical protein VIK89_00255 [Cytophagaceae bacterium]